MSDPSSKDHNKRASSPASSSSDGPSPKKSKILCKYGIKCFRRSPEHLTSFLHPHLKKLLELQSSDSSQGIVLPDDLDPEINPNLVKDQLRIMREHGISTITVKPINKKLPMSSSSSPLRPKAKENRDKKSKGSPTNQKFKKISVELLYKSTEGDDGPSSSSSTEGGTTSISGLSKKSSSSSSTSLNQKTKRTKETYDIHDYCPVVAPKGKFAEKHAAAAPYYLFYTTITSAPQTHNDPLSITFQELLDKSLGNLAASLQINFMVDLPWLLAQYCFAGYSNTPLTILYGEEDKDLITINSKVPHIFTEKVRMRDAFGKHHTKMSIFYYDDKSVRVVVSTANLYEPDWDNRTQGLWVSPRCPPLANFHGRTEEGNGPTRFKKDLLTYLCSYQLPILQDWVERVKAIDFSAINVFLITSVPGTHMGNDYNKFGHRRMAAILSDHCTLPLDPPNSGSSWSIIAQCSSIGSLGPNVSSWLHGQFRASLSKSKIKALMTPPNISLVYPSLENVRKSHDNLLGGGCLPYRKETHMRQQWLQSLMCQWKAHLNHRSRAVPHIKTYCRVSPNATEMAWFMLTSANLSKAAWGFSPSSKIENRFIIRSYEAGVLFIPEFVTQRRAFAVRNIYQDEVPENVEYFPFPYDLPLMQYALSDGPFFMDYII